MINLVILLANTFGFLSFNPDSSSFCYLSNADLKMAKVSEIVYFNFVDDSFNSNLTNTSIDTNASYHSWQFEDGKLRSEKFKLSKSAFGEGYTYEYFKKLPYLLNKRIGSGEEASPQQLFSTKYEYSKSLKLISTVTEYEIVRSNKIEKDISSIVFYSYDPSGRLRQGEHGLYIYDRRQQIIGFFGLINNKLKSYKDYKNEEENKLIAEGLKSIDYLERNDSTGFTPDANLRRAKREGKKNGTEYFFDTYFSPEQRMEIIETSYESIKPNQLLINRKPVENFLNAHGKGQCKFLVFEIAENYFIFYKIQK